MKKLNDSQNHQYLYTIVSHDVANKKILPIEEFITSSHNILSISKYLLSIKSLYEGTINQKKFF